MNSITMKMQADKLIRMALQEDITSEDVSTNAVMRSAVKGTVDLIAKEDGIIAGLDVYARVFQILDEKTEISFNFKDGDAVKKGDLLGTVTGDIRVLLSGERVALNYLQRMSGIATYTKQVSKLLEGSKVTLLDTRKTTPNCRVFEKYAVRIGGGCNHRYNLSDGVLLKDNHIGAAGSVAKAVAMAKEYAPFVRKIEIEVETMEQVKEAVEAGADIIISGAGLPLNLPQFTKGTDTLAAPIISSGRAARIIMKTYKKHYDVYPDMFIIEGSMAGGHLGFGADDITQGKTQTNDEILSDVLAVIEEYGADIPVFVAGGVFDGKDMAHYVNKGAAGVQIATRFIATNECDASDTFKQAVVNAKREDIRIIKSPVGMPARAINSPLLERLDAGETFTARKCNGCLTACKKDDSIPYCISRALIAAVKGDWDNGLFFAGSNADRVDRIMSVQELINEIMTDYRLNKSDI